ncbi:MAG: hypothetical protein KDA86_15245 [Planctomycetaceae bacterium]|nr:hypothetical protein [Planctomycetaceae bacterium]
MAGVQRVIRDDDRDSAHRRHRNDQSGKRRRTPKPDGRTDRGQLGRAAARVSGRRRLQLAGRHQAVEHHQTKDIAPLKQVFAPLNEKEKLLAQGKDPFARQRDDTDEYFAFR